jgi:caa(3)-type oxidase subunit IV
MSDEPASARACTIAYVVLVALAAASFTAAVGGLRTGQATLAIAIAATKALLIAWVFMGLGRAPASMRLALLLALALTVVLLLFVGGDMWVRSAPAVAR